MAQLLDGEAFVKWFKKEYELEKEEYGEIVEYDRWISSADVIDDIESFTPYTTEAEIRAKAKVEAIDEALKALSIFNDREHGNEHFIYGIETAKEILEQLKEG